MSEPWTYEGYWNVVFGARTPRDVVNEFSLTTDTRLHEWLGWAQAEAWMQGGQGQDQPDEWHEYYQRAYSELEKERDLAVYRAAIARVKSLDELTAMSQEMGAYDAHPSRDEEEDKP